MKGILNINNLKKEIGLNENVWLLLYKKGSEQSDCAFSNYLSAEIDDTSKVLLHADVHEVRDIHSNYGITSVPTLLHFEKGELKNIVKGCHQPEHYSAIFEKSGFVGSSKNAEMPKKNVVVYTTPTCSWCTVVKRHLQENCVQYREINIAANQKAADDLVKRSGQQGVPQTEINGEIIVGFDKTRINRLLGIN